MADPNEVWDEVPNDVAHSDQAPAEERVSDAPPASDSVAGEASSSQVVDAAPAEVMEPCSDAGSTEAGGDAGEAAKFVEPGADGSERDAAEPPPGAADLEGPRGDEIEGRSETPLADLADEDFKRPAAELAAIVEALIFASPEPLSPKALFKLLDSEPSEDVTAALEALKVTYERSGGLQLVEVAGGFQIVTRPDLHEWVRRLFHERSTQKLSVQALETLAVIAYRQPITALEITEIRGVNTSGVLNTLLERHLIKIVGRKQVVGRPFMYATTREFLIRFGLNDLSDLPKVEDMAEALGIESPLLVEQMPPEEQLPLSEPDAEGLGSEEPGFEEPGFEERDVRERDQQTGVAADPDTGESTD